MEALALTLFFLGCLGFFDSSEIVTRLKSLVYFLMSFSVYFSPKSDSWNGSGTSFLTLALVGGSFFIFVALGKYLLDNKSLKMEDLDDFDD